MICTWCSEEIEEGDRHPTTRLPYHKQCVGAASTAATDRSLLRERKQDE